MNSMRANRPIPSLRFISYRSILILVVVFFSLWTVYSVHHYYQTKQLIRNLFQQQANEMAITLILGERAMSRVLDRLEEEQANRLLAVGFWLRDHEIHQTLTQSELQKTAETMHVFNVVLFDSQGQREIGLRGGSPWGGRGKHLGGRGQFHADSVETFIQEGTASKIEGLHQSGGFGGARFSVLIRRNNGGVIMINLDAQEQERILQQYGPNALLNEFASRPNIHYVLRKSNGETREKYGRNEESTESEVFEVETPLPNSLQESILIGFDNLPILENDQILFQRMVISFIVVGFLGIWLLLWSHLQKRLVQQSFVLTQLQSYHRTVLEIMEQAVIAWDDSERVTFWNPQAEKLFPTLQNSAPHGVIPDSIRKICDLIRNNPDEIVIDFPDRNRYRIETTMICEPFPTHVLVMTDVTAIEEATRERDRRHHLEELSHVASGVAHEVRNPLNTIDMSIQTLCMEPSTLQPDDRATLDSLRGEIGRINSIIEHFLAFGRPKPPVFSEVDLNSILNDTAKFLEPTLVEKKLPLILEQQDISKIQADAQQMKQAFLNIILNAIDASTENQPIRIETRELENEVVCIIQDMGCGMTEIQIHNIFDPYVTHKPGGTGLGMGIVKRIIDMHNGKIEIESTLHQGSIVRLRFPKLSSL